MNKYIGISKFDDTNANGYSLVVFYSSCPHKCVGCQNPETWKNPNMGQDFTEKKQQELLKHVKENDFIYDALVLSGGDPLCDDNINSALSFIKAFTKTFPQKEVWIYTGFDFQQVKNDKLKSNILNYCNYIKCGRYIEELSTIDNIQYDIRIATRNQKIYKKGVDY